MKSYLSLIPISAKVHKRQSLMTLLCIVIAVFLVTTIFSIADMNVLMEKDRLLQKHGNWHMSLQNITEHDAKEISERSDVAVTSWYKVLNQDMDKEYDIQDKKVVLCGSDEAYITKIWNGVKEGTFPKSENEVMLSINAKDILGINIGDRVIIHTPAGDIENTVSGFGESDSSFENQNYVMSAFVNTNAFQKISNLNSEEILNPIFYVQFKGHSKVPGAEKEIKEKYGVTDDNLKENTGLLALTGFSSSSTMQSMYSIAAVLFVLILIAGVLMISGSINSNVAQRTKFFGMLRCIGASRQQIIRFVRLEALNWCKTAVPIGVALGIIVTWVICAVLRFGIGGEFADMPLFKLSTIGVISGVLVGFVTVLLASQSPAKKAAKSSPVEAASGANTGVKSERHAANTHFCKIETALGIHHAVSARKNLVLMTSSFALSIILFLAFCTSIDLAHVLLPSLRSWQPDCSIIGYENACTLDKGMLSDISKLSGVKHVFGNIFIGGVPVSSDKNVDKVNVVSYDEYMLQCAKKSLVSGDLSKVYGNSDAVLTIYNKDNPLKVSDKIQLGGSELEVTGALSDGLFSDGITIICSEQTLTRLMGEHKYSMISVQLKENASDADISAISSIAGGENIFSDVRESNKETNSTFWAFRIFAYSFLAIIALITVLNIINSTSMSVSAKMKQYGAMRAVGMDGQQLTKMIATEVITYALCGCVVGCVIGLPLNKLLYQTLITGHFGIAWNMPVKELIVILLIVIGAVTAAIYKPAKRITRMDVTETINEL